MFRAYLHEEGHTWAHQCIYINESARAHITRCRDIYSNVRSPRLFSDAVSSRVTPACAAIHNGS